MVFLQCIQHNRNASVLFIDTDILAIKSKENSIWIGNKMLEQLYKFKLAFMDGIVNQQMKNLLTSQRLNPT